MSCPRPVCSLLLAGCLGLLAGCASPSSPNAIMDRVDANRNEYENWPFPIKEAVLSGQVLRGMDATMVYVTRGNPAERVDRGNGDEVWIYRVPGENSGGGGGIMPHGTTVTVGASSPTSYPGSSYPGSSYPGVGYPYPTTGTSISVPIALGGGGNSTPMDEEQIVFHNGYVTHGDGVK